MSKEKEIAKTASCEEDRMIYFEEGLFGFEEYKKFLPVAVEEDSDAVLTLHSTEEEGLAFIIMNPFFLKEDYDPQIPKEALKSLGESKGDGDYSWYVLCVAHKPANQSTVNLKCPIVVNTITRKAKQVILDNIEYGFRHRLEDLTGKEKEIC